MSMGMRILMFSSLLLLALPWLGYRYIDEMKDFLLKGQEDAQLLAAGAIATVLNGRTELFHPVNEPAGVAIESSALYVYQLESPVEVDGYASDWGALQQQGRHFSAESVIYDRLSGAGQNISFDLVLGEYRKKLYALVRVTDNNIVYRDPKYRRLDHSDHIRLELLSDEADHKRLIFITEGQGQVSVYEMQADWKTPVSGKPIYTITGVWRERAGGYYLELRVPASWLGPDSRLMISVANVDSLKERRIDSIVTSLEKENAGQLSLMVTRSIQLERILQGLGGADASICVVDRYRRVRGVFGGDSETALCSYTDTVSGQLVDTALDGTGSVARYIKETGETMLVAVQPVYAEAEVLGAVLVEKSSSHILGMQRASLMKIIIATAVVFATAIVGLLLFAAWLAYRIRRLQQEASSAIDAQGRVVKSQLHTGRRAADELGQLSRDFSSLLSRLKSYTGFLESVPRTLRHEILNPVNTISMSLQKIEVGAGSEPLLNGARKATQQLEMIVHGLTEAAHIEDALTHEGFNEFDFAAMLVEYVANSKLRHGVSRIEYVGPESGVFISGSDLRIAQLLDKLKDNAMDFSENESRVVFKLVTDDDEAVLSIENDGPLIPDELVQALFTGMVSSRHGKNSKPHLGVGLFIAGRIARHHRGSLVINNRDDASGVCVLLRLPMSASA